ncbi:MAG: coproporphyrinogen dehydrogenase HemZ [Christensenella sp.]|nr:coproporphyrinogen dehydrogenase HemZ [Christensenella sp.]
MFALYTDMPGFFNDICDEIRLFFPEKRIDQMEEKEIVDAARFLRHLFWQDENGWHNRVEYFEHGVLRGKLETTPDFLDDISGKAIDITLPTLAAKKAKKHMAKGSIYTLLSSITGESRPWGSLTGIRPTKLMRELAAAAGMQTASKLFREKYHVTERKISLSESIVKRQENYLQGIGERDIDIYIGIPFCISRCKYCSFISRDLRYDAKLKDEYLIKLLFELEQMKPVLEGYSPRAIYIGGGTPTSLEVTELKQLLTVTAAMFPHVREFTVEAGRPDTITPEKLDCIKRAGVGRISINAQTTNDQTLERVGRRHTADDFFRAFALAKKYGFDSINTDIILGLPGETIADVKKTLTDVTSFAPENVTVHTLALKHSSEFALQNQSLLNAKNTEEMVELSRETLEDLGYAPYYLYRQKYMSGNMENVGYALPGSESVYNIDIMEETAQIMAFGAGGISKRLFPERNLLKRAANVKDIRSYIDRTDEMVQRKKDLF